MIKALKIYLSMQTNPYENLATEKYLFDNAQKDCLVLYLWQNKNTVVIGKNQNPWKECLCEELKNDGGYLARRLSGGGAVYHDLGNLNFTFISHSENQDISRNFEIIKLACEFAGIKAEISGRNDVLAGGKKFSGNAFYNSNGKSYHHGTILISADMEKIKKYLTPSREKLVSKGVKSVNSRTVNLNSYNADLTPQKMADLLIKSAEQVLNLNAEKIEISDIKTIKETTDFFGGWDFIYGNTIPFTCEVSARFDWGEFQLLLNIKNGKISDAQFFTDSLDWKISEKINSCLIGCLFNANEINKKLNLALNNQIATDIFNAINLQVL